MKMKKMMLRYDNCGYISNVYQPKKEEITGRALDYLREFIKKGVGNELSADKKAK